MTHSSRVQAALRALPGVALFGVLLAAGAFAVYFHETEVSVLDGRKLAEMDRPTLDSLESKEWMDSVDAYMDDRLPGRDTLLATHAAVKARALYDPVVNGIYLHGPDGQLLEIPPALEARPRLAQEAQALVDAVAPAPVLFVYVPRKEELYADALLPAWGNVYPQLREEITGAFAGKGDVMDLTDMMMSQREAGDAYFRADHHWTPASAKKAADAVADTLLEAGVPVGQDSRAYADLVGQKPFYGSTGRRVTLGATRPDAMVVPVPQGGFNATMCVENVCGLPTMDAKTLNTGALYSNRYRAFIGGNRGMTVITNNSPEASGRVLLLKDSFGNAAATYLAERVAQLVVVDERHYEGPTLDVLAAQLQPDAVVVMHNPLSHLTISFRPEVWTDTSPPVEEPDQPGSYETATYDDVAVVTADGLLLRRNHDQQVSSSMGADARHLVGAIDDTGAAQVWLYAPRKEEVFEDLVPDEFGNLVADKRPQVLDLLDQGQPLVDLTPVLSDPALRDTYYFRTDHHWTPAAAAVVVDTIVDQLAAQGVDVPHDSRVWRSVEGPLPFWGSEAALMPQSAPIITEPMAYLEPDGGFRARMCGDDTCDRPGLVEEWLANPDPAANRYYAFLGGGFRTMHLHNDSPQARGTVVMLKDSYAHPVALMLAERVTDLYLIDERGFDGSIPDFVREVDADAVVVMHNQVTLLSRAFNSDLWAEAR